MFKRNLQPKLRNQTYVATFSMLLGVSSTHTPLIVVESLKCDTFGIGNVHTNTHTQTLHTLSEYPNILKHQGFIKIQETPQRPFADQMDEPAPCFFFPWDGWDTSCYGQVWQLWYLGSWDPGNTKIRLFTLLFFFVTCLGINEMCHANLTDLGGLWADMMLGCVLP